MIFQPVILWTDALIYLLIVTLIWTVVYVRGREHLLALRPEPMDEAARWIDHHRRFWEDSLSRLDAFVQSSAPRKPAPTRKPRKKKP